MMGRPKRISIETTIKRYITPCSKVCNMNGLQVVATIESITAYARHAFGNGHGGQADATVESPLTDARHRISSTIIRDRFGNNYLTRILVISTCYFCNTVFCNKIVIDAVNLDIIRICTERK